MKAASKRLQPPVPPMAPNTNSGAYGHVNVQQSGYAPGPGQTWAPQPQQTSPIDVHAGNSPPHAAAPLIGPNAYPAGGGQYAHIQSQPQQQYGAGWDLSHTSTAGNVPGPGQYPAANLQQQYNSPFLAAGQGFLQGGSFHPGMAPQHQIQQQHQHVPVHSPGGGVGHSTTSPKQAPPLHSPGAGGGFPAGQQNVSLQSSGGAGYSNSHAHPGHGQAPSGLMPRASKGECPLCQQDVFNDQERRKTTDGRYCHLSCYDLSLPVPPKQIGAAQAQQILSSTAGSGPELMGGSPQDLSWMPLTVPARTISPPQGAQHHAPHGPAAGQLGTKELRGACVICGKDVFNVQTRLKTDEGKYAHADCFSSSQRAGSLNLQHSADVMSYLSKQPSSPLLSNGMPSASSESGSPSFPPPHDTSGILHAMYKGQCIVCRGNVMSDQECRKTRDGRYLHISCFEEDDSRPDSPPPPPPPLPRSPLLQTASFKLPHPSSSTYQEDFQTPSPAELSKVMTHKNAVSSGKSLPATSGTPPSRTSPGTPPHTSPDSLMGPFKTPPASLLNTASSLVTPLNNVRLSEEIL